MYEISIPEMGDPKNESMLYNVISATKGYQNLDHLKIISDL